MGRARAEAVRSVEGDGPDRSGAADELRARILGGVSRLAARAQQGARRVRDAAQDLRNSPALQHALAARERGNMEAAFWLLNEEFTRSPADPDLALLYWDVALSLGRVDIARDAGVQLIEGQAAAGQPELAAQYWLELVKEAPEALVSPAAIATLLPALRRRVEEAGASEDRRSLRGHLRRAIRHAVDPRNEPLHPGMALRIFDLGQDVNPEAAARAAEAALESPHLHEAKRVRLRGWLSERSQSAASEEVEAEAEPEPELEAEPDAEPDEPDEPCEAEEEAEPEACARPQIRSATLVALDEDGLTVRGEAEERIPYASIQAVAVAEIVGLDEQPATVIDLILNWARRRAEPLEIVRLRLHELDLESLDLRERRLGSDFAALMGEIMERTSAVPLPDPESALGTCITCFGSPELYEQVALRTAS